MTTQTPTLFENHKNKIKLDAQTRKIIRPSDYTQSMFYLGGTPLTISRSKRRHLYPIYNNPYNAIMLKFGRQTEKSSTLGYKMLGTATKYKFHNSLYIAPTGKQVSVFSNDKIMGAINESTVMQNHYINTRTKNQVEYKELSNGSKLYYRSAYLSADSARGISSHMCCFDEIQDLLSDHIPVIEQSMGHALDDWDRFKKTHPKHIFFNRMYAGTPKTLENTLEEYWRNSTQCEWIIRCQHCKKHNFINKANVGPKCLICRKCAKPIHYEYGQWYAFNPTAFIDGFRLPQIVLPWINDRNDPDRWYINVMQPLASYSDQKFHNEILALPYANAKNPISVPHLKQCCSNDRKMIMRPEDVGIEMPTELTAGIDWGKGDIQGRGTSFSILSIGGMWKGKFRCVFAKRYVGAESDALVEIKDMLRWVRRFKCKLIIADTGDGRTANATLVKDLGPQRFAEIYSSHSQKDKIKWDPRGMYIINRTQMMTDIFMEIRENLVEWWGYEEFKTFGKDFLNCYVDYSERTRLTRYDHVDTDDYVHAHMYSRIGNYVLRGHYDKYLYGNGRA